MNGVLAVAERADLAGVLNGWVERSRLDKAVLARLAGIGRDTLYRVLRGMPAQPDTLRKLARGLATDPFSGEVDQAVRYEALRDFAQVTGFELMEDDTPPSLEAAIRAEGVKSPRKAARLAAFVRKYPNMSTNQLRLVDALLDNLEED